MEIHVSVGTSVNYLKWFYQLFIVRIIELICHEVYLLQVNAYEKRRYKMSILH